MIKILCLDDLDILLSINPKLKSKIKYLKNNEKDIIIKGYYNNDKLQSYVIYKIKKVSFKKNVFIVSLGALNKFSLLKMVVYLSQNFSKYNKKTISKDYINYLENIKNLRLINFDYEIKNKKIEIYKISFKSDLLKIHSFFYLNNFIDIYEKVKKEISNQNFMNNKKKYIRSYYKKKMKLFNEVDKNDTINILIPKSKTFFNFGENNYIKKLKDNGYIEISSTTNIFKQKCYTIISKTKTKNNKPICKLIVYNIKEFNVLKSPYRNNPNFYRNKIKFINEIIYKFAKTYMILDYKGRVFYDSLYLEKLNQIYLNCLILNEIYIEKIKEDFVKYNIEKDFESFMFRKSILQCKRIIGKEETRKFFNRYFKNLSKNQNDIHFNHDNFIIYYKEVIYSPFLTKKALTKILQLPFDKIKNYKILEEKFYNLNLNCNLTINNKEKRKLISHYVKFNKDLNDLYSNLILKYSSQIIGNLKKEDIKKIICFVNELNKYSNKYEKIDIFNFINSFKKQSMNIVNKKIKSIFNEYILDNRKEKIGLFIKKLLGCRKENIKSIIKNPKKLYYDLNKIYNIKKIIDGDFPNKYIDKILNQIKFRNIDIPRNLLYWTKIEKKCSVEYLMAGNITNCCMNFGSSKAIDYALQKGFGIISIYENNTIVSNSVIWIQKDLNYLVLDNIEAISRVCKYNDIIKEEYLKITQYIKEKFNLKHIVQGYNYNDIYICDDYIVEKNKTIHLKQNGLEINKNFYSDASRIHPLNKKEYDEIVNEIKNFNKLRKAL